MKAVGSAKKKFRSYPIGYFHINIAEVRTEDGKLFEHRLTKVNHPWTNGQVERMNRTLKETTVKRYHYASHEQLREHLRTFVSAYNIAKWLKTLRGLTVFEYVNKCWIDEPKRFIKNPSHHFPGLNN